MTDLLQHTRPLLPLWLKLAYTLFVLILVPVYWLELGVGNFLWGSDIALLVLVIGLWRESRLLISMMGVGVLIPEIYWMIDFFSHLVAGKDVIGLDATAYMFAKEKSLLVRSMSLFHIFLPMVILFALNRLGYDSRAFPAQIVFSWIVLALSYFLTEPAKNINWVFGITEVPQTWMPELVYLFLVMMFFPLVIFWPTHIVLRKLFSAPQGKD